MASTKEEAKIQLEDAAEKVAAAEAALNEEKEVSAQIQAELDQER